MFKQVGLQFIDAPTQVVDAIAAMMTRLSLYYRSQDNNFVIPSDNRRNSYRIQVDDELPSMYKIECFIYIESVGAQKIQRLVKIPIRDISTGGISLVCPFKDIDNMFETGREFELQLLINNRTFISKAVVRSTTGFHPSKALQKFYSRFIKELRKQDQHRERIQYEM